jgi:hypothetical protein
MSFFVMGDVLELIVECSAESGICERFLVPYGEGFLVECIFEVLELKIVSEL